MRRLTVRQSHICNIPGRHFCRQILRLAGFQMGLSSISLRVRLATLILLLTISRNVPGLTAGIARLWLRCFLAFPGKMTLHSPRLEKFSDDPESKIYLLPAVVTSHGPLGWARVRNVTRVTACDRVRTLCFHIPSER